MKTYLTCSDAGSVKIGIDGRFTIRIPNGYGDGKTLVEVIDAKEIVPNWCKFLTSIEGTDISIFNYDCKGGAEIEKLSGRYGIFVLRESEMPIPGYDGCVVFQKWSD